jgi:hypothetical protein
LGWQTGTNAAARATTGRRIRISPPGGGSARCNASKAWAQPKDFSPCMLPPTTPSTSNATSFRLKRTAVSGLRLWKPGIKRLARREQRCVGRVITLIVRQRDSAPMATNMAKTGLTRSFLNAMGLTNGSSSGRMAMICGNAYTPRTG